MAGLIRAPMRAAPGGRARRLAGSAVVAAALAVVSGALLGVTPVAAADPVSFGTPTASSTFGKFIEFKQPITIAGTPKRVDLLLATPGDVGPEVIPLPIAQTTGDTLSYSLDLSGGSVVPNTTFTARWQVVDASDRTWLGPAVVQTYVDDRFQWQELDGKVVRVHWYKGGQALGQKAVKIGDDAIAAAASLLGVTESEPIDFFVYADQQPFYDALGPGTRENVGGQAHPDIRTLFALIAPDEIDAGWIESVVPHELTHVVFATAVDNPYHEPPHWLNEGLAVYLSDGYDAAYKATVEGAAADGTLMPLDGLAGAFPTTKDRFFLAYGESVSAVDRIVRVNGRDALVKLIRSYHDGVSDDEAFKAALGTDVAGFEADWLAELGAKPPVRTGPQPAPGGPLPAGWSGPQPNPSFEVVGSAAPGAPAPAASTPAAGGVSTPVLIVALAAIVVALGGGGAFVALRRRSVPAAWRPVPASRPPAAPWAGNDWSLPKDDDSTETMEPSPANSTTELEPPVEAGPTEAPVEPPPADRPAS